MGLMSGRCTSPRQILPITPGFSTSQVRRCNSWTKTWLSETIANQNYGAENKTCHVLNSCVFCITAMLANIHPTKLLLVAAKLGQTSQERFIHLLEVVFADFFLVQV